MFRHGIMAKDKILYHKYLILKSIPAYSKNSNRVLCAIISSKMSNFCVQIKGKDKVSECINKFKAFIKSFI